MGRYPGPSRRYRLQYVYLHIYAFPFTTKPKQTTARGVGCRLMTQVRGTGVRVGVEPYTVPGEGEDGG
jgi:hypothetical protein